MSLTDNNGDRVFPSWIGLLKHAAEALEKEDKAKLANGIIAMLDMRKYQQAAEIAREGLQGTLWRQFFLTHIKAPSDNISQASMALPKAIWGLGNRVITTNYDTVLRQACKDPQNFVEVDNTHESELAGFKRNDLPYPSVWHLHGRIDNIKTLIFTPKSYDKLYAEAHQGYQAALAVFKGLCCDLTLIFIGCSLDDAEILQEMANQHQLFDGNIGPHYALVHEDHQDAIRQKIGNLPIELLTFTAFGQPLVSLVNTIARHVPQQLTANKRAADEQPETPSAPPTKKEKVKMALLCANPWDNPQTYTALVTELSKIACPIDHFSLSIRNLNQLEGYNYLLILSKMVNNKLLIEDEYLCSRRITLTELEDELDNDHTQGIFIFVDQLPHENVRTQTHLPILILPTLEKNQPIVFQLFRKNNLDPFNNGMILNHSAFNLSPIKAGTNTKSKNGIKVQETPLPKSIDPKALSHFIGRSGDLEQICRKLLILAAENSGVLTIKGSGGIGKTITVKKVAAALAWRGYFSGGITFVDCEFIPDASAFKYKLTSAFNLEQADDYEQYLTEQHDHLERLIILDNVETLLHLEDTQDIKSLLGVVCDYATIVTTSRECLQVEGEIVYEMRQLTTDEAEVLFLAGIEQRNIDPQERTLLRQKILEELLDNNPLAITLITGNMPKGKNLTVLKADLEKKLFETISHDELAVFDSHADLNIARKKSIYASILYSYKDLSPAEQKAFKLLSLFPDGIDIESFRRVSRARKKPKNRDKQPIKKDIITDKVIKALDNKSMIENNSGHIRLQSIVGKFADKQLDQRNDLAHCYDNAFEHNHELLTWIAHHRLENPKLALEVFNGLQDNFLKTITNCDKINSDKNNILVYIKKLMDCFIQICALKGFFRALCAKVHCFQDSTRQTIDVLLLCARYYDGDFGPAFYTLKQAIALEAVNKLDRTIVSNQILAERAINIYEMEGDALFSANYDATHKIGSHGYPGALFYLGEYNPQLAEICQQNFQDLEVFGNMGVLQVANVDDYLTQLYDKDHLDRMQVSYLRAKLKPLRRKKIQALVSVNPYTKGLKSLMLAFIEHNTTKAKALYQEAIEQLEHIKYYYVEAVYFYAQFLQTHDLPEFDELYQCGFDLTLKHHYRFLQYRFEQLLNPTEIAYDASDYPLPDNVDFSGYIRFLSKYHKNRKK